MAGTQLINSSEQLNDLSGGWIPTSVPITFVSSDSPSYLVSVNYNVTGTFGVGMKMRLTHLSSTKNFIVTQVTFTGTNTYLNLYGGTDFTLNVTGAITNPYYSWEKSPFEFPLNPDKWTIKVTDTSNRSQSSPVAGTWYNLGSLAISVPIGSWNVDWFADLYFNTTTTGGKSCFGTLSTANNSESDSEFTSRTTVVLDANAGTYWGFLDAARHKIINLTSKTSYFFNIKTDHSVSTIGFDGSSIVTMFRAVCAYL